MLDRYLAQVRLLLSVLPDIARETAFAIKGGTAINLFYRDLPRLSVDVDLTWLPVADRQSSLRDVDAALDRRHPRDLFDVKLLYENEGLTDDLFRVFMVYVASSGRPMHELLAPATPFNEGLYDDEFVGMTREAVSREALAEVGRRLHADIRSRLHGDVAEFLLSLHDAEPDFELIGLPEAADLPAVRWKLLNLKRLKDADPGKHAAQRGALETLFR